MPDGYCFIADAPLELAAATDDQPRRSTIQVAALGSYSDPRYGQFKITAQQVSNWQRLLASHFHGRVPIDVDHHTDKGISSEAAAWIIGLNLDGGRVLADVEWTPLGESAVEQRRYLYISPTFVEQLADQQGRKLGPALLRAALTNNPFLHDMPAVSLAGATLAQRLEEPAEEPALPADSRRAMPLTTEIATALGVAEDADDATALAAIEALKAPAPEPAETKTLEAQATEAGKVLLSADQVAQLQQDASEGKAAASELREQKFTLAFETALREGRLDAADETRELHKGIYEVDPERSLKLLASLPQIVNTTARGTGGADTPAAEFEGQAVDEDRALLLDRAEKLASEQNIDVFEAAKRLAAQEA